MSRRWNFLKQQECWKGHEQALILTIQKYTNFVTNRRVGGSWPGIQITNVGSITSTASDQSCECHDNSRRSSGVCPSFLSVGRTRRSTLLGEKEGPTVVMWKSLSEQEKAIWLVEASTMHNWVVRCIGQRKGRRKSAHLSSAIKKSSLTMMKRNQNRRRTKRTGAKQCTSWAERTTQVMVQARQHQNGNE